MISFYQEGFTEIHTPKIGAKSAEGGANLFRLEYFHRPAILQQSPQFYKQMMVGVFDRVFETAPVFRAESIIPSDTSTNTPAWILKWDISMDLKILWQWRPDFFSIRWLCLKRVCKRAEDPGYSSTKDEKRFRLYDLMRSRDL